MLFLVSPRTSSPALSSCDSSSKLSMSLQEDDQGDSGGTRDITRGRGMGGGRLGKYDWEGGGDGRGGGGQVRADQNGDGRRGGRGGRGGGGWDRGGHGRGGRERGGQGRGSGGTGRDEEEWHWNEKKNLQTQLLVFLTLVVFLDQLDKQLVLSNHNNVYTYSYPINLTMTFSLKAQNNDTTA